jgi:hypothetical protein
MIWRVMGAWEGLEFEGVVGFEDEVGLIFLLGEVLMAAADSLFWVRFRFAMVCGVWELGLVLELSSRKKFMRFELFCRDVAAVPPLHVIARRRRERKTKIYHEFNQTSAKNHRNHQVVVNCVPLLYIDWDPTVRSNWQLSHKALNSQPRVNPNSKLQIPIGIARRLSRFYK